jgi:actin-like ATPase involved in cell morphogenesis
VDAARPIAAAIDIGSNSIKMTIGRPDGVGGVEQIDWASEVVRLGQDLDRTGRLDDERIEIAIDTLKRFAERARVHGASRILAVATEATRSAQNGKAFLERVRRETGIEVRLLTGLEEAALTFRGLGATTDLSGRVVVADIGGGSTELIVADGGVVEGARSIPLGSGRLTDRLVHADPPTAEELAATEAQAAAAIARVGKALRLPTGPDVRFIVVGGTGEFMARLVPDERAIQPRAIRQVLGKLAVLTTAELADEIDAPEARARVLPAGIAIVAAIADRIGTEHVQVARSGIRTGLLLQAFIEQGIPGRNDARGKRKPRRNHAAGARPEPHVGAGGEAPFHDAMKPLIAERWARLRVEIPAAIAGDDSESVHDVRVSSRRLRAAMDVAAPAFPQAWFRRLHREARIITRELGAVRDLDVLLEALRADRDAAPLTEHPGIDRLIDHIECERRGARAEMEAYLEALLKGPLWGEVTRHFGPLEQPARQNAPDEETSP